MHSSRKVPTESSLEFQQALVLLIEIRSYDVESCMLGRNCRTRSSYSSSNVSLSLSYQERESMRRILGVVRAGNAPERVSRRREFAGAGCSGGYSM